MSILSDLKYAKTDEWVRVDGSVATIGVSDFAQEELSDVVFWEASVDVGAQIKKGTTCATLESVKAAADVSAPVSGTVIEINTSLGDAPESVNSSPYEKAWMLKIEMSDPAELAELMDAASYEKYCQER